MSYKTILLLVFALFSTACYAEEKPEYTPPTRPELLKMLLGSYQTLTGTYYINLNCKILDGKQSDKFKLYVGELNKTAQQEKIAPLKHLYKMQQNGKTIAGITPWKECGDKARGIVNQAYRLSGLLYRDLVLNK